MRKAILSDSAPSSTLAKLLADWGSPATYQNVLAAGVTKRNWDVFCTFHGRLDGRQWKLRELAEFYGISVPRVSQILKTVESRLDCPGKDLSGTARTRFWQQARLDELARQPVSNANTPDLAHHYSYLWRHDFDAIVLTCGRARWLLQGSRKWRSPTGDPYVIFWMAKVGVPPNPCLGCADLYAKTVSGRTVFDDGQRFYVFDSVIRRRDKKPVVRLKPATFC